MKSFLTRLISGIVLLAIIISTGIVGGPVLFGLYIADFPDWILGVPEGVRPGEKSVRVSGA